MKSLERLWIDLNLSDQHVISDHLNPFWDQLGFLMIPQLFQIFGFLTIFYHCVFQLDFDMNCFFQNECLDYTRLFGCCLTSRHQNSLTQAQLSRETDICPLSRCANRIGAFLTSMRPDFNGILDIPKFIEFLSHFSSLFLVD